MMKGPETQNDEGSAFSKLGRIRILKIIKNPDRQNDEGS